MPSWRLNVEKAMAEKRSSSGRELWPPPAWAIPQACDTMQEVAVEEDKVLGAVRQVPEAVGDEETATCPTRWAPLALGEHAHSRAEDAGGKGARHVMVWGPAMEEPSFVNRDPLPACQGVWQRPQAQQPWRSQPP